MLDSNQVPFFLGPWSPFSQPKEKQTCSSKWLFVFLLILIDCCHSRLHPPTLPPPPPPLGSPGPQRVGRGSHTNAERDLWAKQRGRPPKLLLNAFNEASCVCVQQHRASMFGVTKPVAGNMSAGLWSRGEDRERRGFPSALVTASRNFDSVMPTQRQTKINGTFRAF